MSELLPQLDRELEVVRDFGRPRLGRVLVGRAIEGAIDLDGIEVARVEIQLVGVLELGRVERAVPGAIALRVAPARGADIEARRGRHGRYVSPSRRRCVGLLRSSAGRR